MRTIEMQDIKRKYSIPMILSIFMVLVFAYSFGTHPNSRGSFAIAAQSFQGNDAYQVTKLNVPAYKQQYLNSCEASALRMVLVYHGLQIKDDMDVVRAFGYNPRIRNNTTNTWDDPRLMFVGFVDGRNSPNMSAGYGVYGQPVKRAAEMYGRKAEYISDISTSTMRVFAQSIRDGAPIVIWGYTSLTGSPYTWNVPQGGKVTAFKGEHARVIVGVIGSSDNPLGFYVNDPTTGQKDQFWMTADLLKHMNAVPGVTNQAVIVK